MKKIIVTFAVILALLLPCATVFNVAYAETDKDVKTVTARLSSNTGENTKRYVTTFTIRAGINSLANPTDGRRFHIYERLVFADNVISVKFLSDVTKYGLEIKKSTAEEREFYYIVGYLDVWTSPLYFIYPDIEVVSEGEVEFYKSETYTPVISNVETVEVETGEEESLLDKVMNKLDEAIAGQNSDGLDMIWEIVRPIVVYAITGLITGVIIGKVVSRLIRRKYDAKAIANEVLSQLTTKDISIDLETLTKKELADIGAELKNNLKDGMTDIANMKRSVALMCNALSKSKVLTQEERTELAAEAKKLDAEAAKEVTEKVTVRLEKAEPAAEETKEKPTDGGLFGYMEK